MEKKNPVRPERILEQLSSQRLNFPKIHYNVFIGSSSFSMIDQFPA